VSIKEIFESLGVHVPENPDTLQVIKTLRESRHVLRSILSQFPDGSVEDFDRETESAFELFDHVEQFILQGVKVPPLLDLLMAEDIDDYFEIVHSLAPHLSVTMAAVATMRQ
jgi:hypothetical protein